MNKGKIGFSAIASLLAGTMMIAAVHFGGASGCGSSSGGNNNNNNNNGTSCAAGSNDFYVVENASCTNGQGKLSRINPDVPCKEEILTGLNCPVDFVLSTEDEGIGYLSSRVDGVSQVDLNAKTSLDIANEVTVTTTGLSLMENLTDDEREELCGGNTLTDAILFVADEGIDESGAVLRWCLITDDPASLADNNPNPVTIISTADIENPRGVAVQNRTQVFATGVLAQTQEDDEEVGVLVRREVTGAGATEILSNQFSTEVKDICFDADGTLLIADAGTNIIVRADLEAQTGTVVQTDLSGPRDILPLGGGNYAITQFTGDDVVQSALDGETPTVLTTGLTLDDPNGIAQ